MRHESLFFLYSTITRIKGIGSATATALQRLLPVATSIDGAGLPMVRDLLFHLPVAIVDRRFTCELRTAPDGVVATFVVRVDSHLPPPPASRWGGRKPYKVICSNDSGDITLVFFHAQERYLTQQLPVGGRRVISGRVEHFDHHLQMTHPDIIAPVEQLAEVQKPEPVYPLTVGLTSRRIGKIVEDALAKLPELPEWIDFRTVIPAQAGISVSPFAQVEKEIPACAGMTATPLSWKAALTLAHHPQSPEELFADAPARMRLAYDEILANQLYLALLRRNTQAAGAVITGRGVLTEKLRAALPFALTHGQEQVLREIGADMASGKRMARMLQGDVGSGKTIVALLAMLRAVEQGMQAALMVPTEIIAQQHYEVISKLAGDAGVTLLTGSVKGAARQEALARIASGEAGIVVGTHALFQEHVAFQRLALVVVDEQHRFGVKQRMALSAKGDAPHLLHMTATPIPRSLTMTLYGDMDCSVLREKPAGRQPIATRAIPAARYEQVMERLKAALAAGEKVYWICPLIEDASDPLSNPEQDVAAAQTRFTEFAARFGPVVGLAHGRMKGEERDAQMRRFASGETRLLVATTVVEVGVDVRDATIMVIEQAQRFGLSQLHQLRGRVGRGDKASSCVLLYSEDSGFGIQDSGKENPSLARLSIIRDTEDGFKIAEADLALRGGGDLLGARQSGMPRFVFTDLLRHQPLLERAREEVAVFLELDPRLESERGQALRILLQLFGFEMPD